MPKPEGPRTIRLPTNEEARLAFEEYTTALGKVVYAWNYLHEKLALLLVAVTDIDHRDVLLIKWHKLRDDGKQRRILTDAVKEANWTNIPTAKEHLLWLLDRTNSLAEDRNDAVHAPTSLLIGSDPDKDHVMGAAFLSSHPRAKRLEGKVLLAEFAWCERCAEDLSVFAKQLEAAIRSPQHYPLPERPVLPSRPEGESG